MRNALSSRRHNGLALLAGFALLAAGCGAAVDAQYVDEALDSTDTAQSQSALLVPATSDAVNGMSADQIAATAASKAGTYYQPANCVTATATGPTTVYKLNDCTGPHGLVHVTGTVTVVFSVAGDGVHAVATAKELKVNSAVIDVDAAAVYTVNGDTKKLQVTSKTSGTGVRGNFFVHTGAYVATWDATCMTLDGAWQTKAGGYTWSTTVANYKRCSGMCPAAGGSVVYTGGISGVTVTVTFDGGGTAKWVSSRGRTGAVIVNCAQ